MPWWPEDAWAAMRRGEDCPICAIAHLAENEHGHLVAESSHSYIHLKRNQTHAGHCAVILKRHAADVHEMTAEELAGFWGDVAALGRAISALFEPVKIDALVMGHLCPHVHCHVFPQYRSDDPQANPDINEGDLRLAEAEQRERVELLRERLGPLH